MYEEIISRFQNRLGKIQDKVDEGLLYLFAQFEVEDLLKDAIQTRTLLEKAGIDRDLRTELDVVINQISQYLEDLKDLIEIEKLKTL